MTLIEKIRYCCCILLCINVFCGIAIGLITLGVLGFSTYIWVSTPFCPRLLAGDTSMLQMGSAANLSHYPIEIGRFNISIDTDGDTPYLDAVCLSEGDILAQHRPGGHPQVCVYFYSREPNKYSLCNQDYGSECLPTAVADVKIGIHFGFSVIEKGTEVQYYVIKAYDDYLTFWYDVTSNHLDFKSVWLLLFACNDNFIRWIIVNATLFVVIFLSISFCCIYYCVMEKCKTCTCRKRTQQRESTAPNNDIDEELINLVVNDDNDTGSEDVTVNLQRQLATCSDDGQNSNVHVQLVTATLECAGPSLVDQPNNPLEEVDGYPSGFQGHPELLKTSTAETPLSSETYPTTESDSEGFYGIPPVTKEKAAALLLKQAKERHQADSMRYKVKGIRNQKQKIYSELLQDPKYSDLVHQVASVWQELGLYLGVEQAVLDKVNIDNKKKRCDEACEDVLSRWLKEERGTGDKPREWSTVIEALSHMDQVDLAKRLKQMT